MKIVIHVLVHILFALGLLIVSTGPVVAEEMYVDTRYGDDGNEGSVISPWRTMRHALCQLTPGDVLQIVPHGPKHPVRETISPSASGQEGKFITIGSASKNEPVYVTATNDFSQSSAGVERPWREADEGSWQLSIDTPVLGLWSAPKSEWDSDGVLSLRPVTMAEGSAGLTPGSWRYDNEHQLLYYLPSAGERIADLHLEAQVRMHTILVHGKTHLELAGMVAMFVGQAAAVAIRAGSSHIRLGGLGARHAYNGISVGQGGSDVIIENCQVTDIANNGIVFGGSPGAGLRDTVVRNCMVGNVASNDCITLHKDKAGNDVGDSHLLEKNTLYNCAEQGLDITSGRDIVLRENRTFSNGDSAILVGHGAKNVTIVDHVSVGEGKVAALIVGPSDNVRVYNSLFYNSKSRQIRVHNATNLAIERSTFIAGYDSRPLYVEFIDNPSGVRLENNIFTSIVESFTPLYAQFLRGVPDSETVFFNRNVFWPGVVSGHGYLVQGGGRFSGKQLGAKYGVQINDWVVNPGITVREDGEIVGVESIVNFGIGCRCRLPSTTQ